MMNFKPAAFIVGFVYVAAAIDDNNWYPCGEADTLAEAERIAIAKSQRGALVVAVFPAHHWNHGQVTCKPRLVIDNRDHSNAPIRNAEFIIISASSTVL